MNSLRILHLASDDKFVDHAFTVFEEAFPKRNEVLVIAKFEKLKFVKLEPKRVVSAKMAHKRIPKISTLEYRNYDIVVFHSFNFLIYPEIFNVPENIPTIWLGFGHDYYDVIADPQKLLLPQTYLLSRKLQRLNIRSKVVKALQLSFDILGISKSRIKAIEKLSLFSPVLPNEYELVRAAKSWDKFPESARWNYGTIEDNFVKGFEREQVEGDALLVGNSASLTCNHFETLQLLNRIGLSNRKIVAPLSYGDRKYGEKVAQLGKSFFGKNFQPLMDFMSVTDYVATIKKCGYVIMNHKRQQAVGNIVIMLYLGAKVFLREENPAYVFFKEMGVAISSVQELEKLPALLDRPLTYTERKKNRMLVSDYWSRKRGVERTKVMVEQALASKGSVTSANIQNEHKS